MFWVAVCTGGPELASRGSLPGFWVDVCTAGHCQAHSVSGEGP